MGRTISRRTFVRQVAASSTTLGAAALCSTRPTRPARAGLQRAVHGGLEAGEGVIDTTPPLGIEMAGFHRPAGKERRINGIRQPAAARAIVLRLKDTQIAIISLDICGVSQAMTERVQRRISQQLSIPSSHVRLCATHTHSMPTFRYFRQWGAISPDYMASVETQIVQAVRMAQEDLAPAELNVGKSLAPGASNNRTTKTWKTEDQFTEGATDADRWLDTVVHVMHFGRAAGKKDLLSYHFSAHPVCYHDDQAGPDWPGLVGLQVSQKHKITPSFLQGHSGDVNAGDATHWIGTAEDTARPVAAAISKALDSAQHIPVNAIRLQTERFALPLDKERFAAWLTAYEKDPSQCNRGHWVDSGFAEDWYQGSVKRKRDERFTRVPLTAMQLGELGLVFHPAELYSCYGLTIQRDSPLPNTLVVGYADDLIGYLPDPNAYAAGEYSAITVPKIIDLPPFLPTAGRALAGEAVRLLNQLVG